MRSTSFFPIFMTRKTTMNRFNVRPLTLSILVANLVILCSGALWVSISDAADAPKPAAKAALTVSVVHAARSTAAVKLTANGGLAAWQEASVGAEANGLRIAELHAAVGDSVQKGQLLATFDAESVQADVALARAALAEAQATALDAAANAARARAVDGSGALSAQKVNQYLTQEQVAKARVDSAKAQLDAQLLRLKHSQVLAPDAGVISARSATVGAVVGAGTELFKLIRQGRLEWRGEVTAAEMGRIAPGTPVVLTAPGGTQGQGRVRVVAPTVDAQTRNGLVYVDLLAAMGKGAAAAFKPGMYARGEFALGNSSALLVPQTAVVVRDGFSYVYRVGADKRVSQTKVQTGRVVDNTLEILSGLKPEDQIVASGGSFLSDGDLVKVVSAAAPASAPAAAASK
jgi:RND family efflux transporter MFP subunit